MLSRVIQRYVYRFGLTKFSEEIAQTVLPTAPQLNKPQVIDTKTREKYREEHKIKFKRIPEQDLKDNWTRDFHNRIYTEKEAVA